MSEKTLNTRIIHKHDTEINWSKATNFIPKKGEIIIYDKDNNYNYERIKVGDGVTLVNNLPFYGSSIENILDGIASGSVRTSSSTTESTDYKLGTAAFAEGKDTKAKGNYSHAEGYSTTASGAYSHAEGRSSTASGSVSHAEGTDTVASGIRSHASGWGTVAKGQNQTAIGKYNVEDTSEKYALIVGNGTSTARSNAFTVDWNGNAEAGGKKLATETYVEGKIAGIPTPDVSGQIETHNSSSTAHSDIRQSISEKANSNDLASHIGDSNIHTSATEKAYWNAKASTDIATKSSNGLMSSIDKSKLDGIESGANKTTVDADLNTESTNPVQNKAITNWLAENVKNYRIAFSGMGSRNAYAYLTSEAVSPAAAPDNSPFYAIEDYPIGVLWSNIADKPSTFPPSSHTHNYNTDIINKPTIPTKTSQLANDSGYITSAPVISVNGKTGAVTLSASDVGALPAGTVIPSTEGLATETYVNNKVAGIVNSAPEALDTLNELAEALGDDPHFATTVATQIGGKVDKVNGKGLSTNDYTTAEKNKLAGIAVGANNYIHPSTHPATMITEDSTHRFVTDTEKNKWNESEVFIATYNTTTNAEIEAAYQAGKTILLDVSGSNLLFGYFVGRNSDGTTHLFYSIIDGDGFAACACTNNSWKAVIHQGLPTTSTSDIGKILAVNSDGNWKATTPEINVFIATYGTTTFDELLSAYNSGKTIMAKYSGNIYQLVSADTSLSFIFVSVVKDSEYITYVECKFTGDWYFYNGKRLLPDAGTSNQGKYLSVNSSGVAAWTSLPTDTNKVDLSSAQTISGAKTFSANLAASSNLTVGGNITATGTITGSKVYNAVWNDYAEWFEKDNEEEIFTPGEICIWTGNGVTKATKANDKAVVGIVSDSYGHILGGENLKDMEENNKKFVPIGLKGRVKCKVTGPVEIGDLIVTSDITGVGIVNNNANNGIIIGKALENSNDTGIKEIIVLI